MLPAGEGSSGETGEGGGAAEGAAHGAGQGGRQASDILHWEP